MHAIRTIRLARNDAPQKDHIFAITAVIHCHIIVDDMRQPLRQIGQLMIMGGEQRLGAQFRVIVNILDYGPGNR